MRMVWLSTGGVSAYRKVSRLSSSTVSYGYTIIGDLNVYILLWLFRKLKCLLDFGAEHQGELSLTGCTCHAVIPF